MTLNINTACGDREQGQPDLTYDAKGPQELELAVHIDRRGRAVTHLQHVRSLCTVTLKLSVCV